MEEYLRRVQSRLGAGLPEGPIHAVLGGPEPDVGTVAATLCLALHLSQKQPSGGVCVPLLCRKQCSTELPEETVRYLRRVKISESELLWREEIDLVNLHHTGKLLLTLLRDGLLESSEYHAVESSVLRVVHQDGQRDAADDGGMSALTTVAREILQDAAEQSRAALGELLGDALELLREALWIKQDSGPEELEDLLRSLEEWGDMTVDQPDEVKQQELTQLLMMELKEFTDGEMTLALTSLTTDQEDWHNYVDDLKLFCHQNGYDVLVAVLSISDTVHHPRQQVAVYSNNTDILNQICAELEESSSWSFSGETEERENLQVYHIPINTSSPSGTLSLLLEDIQSILKDFVNRRNSVLGCHPSSRTSSTEGVAGSVEFSQGSSGINDMDGSDTERTDGNGDVATGARVIAEGEEEMGAVGVGVSGELLSPDSGMTTIRSSRSSKESSVFLSDDSPAGEGPAGGPGLLLLRNPSALGFSSLSPPVPPERRKHRSSKNKKDNFNLFSFDPLHSRDQPLPAEGELVDSLEGVDEVERRAGSSSLSELDEMSLIDFSAPNSIGGLESRNSSIDHHGQIYGNEMMDTMVPPTPVNSLVGSRPPSSCGVRFFPEDVVERINGLQHKDSVSSSLSETWDDLSSETQGAAFSSDISALNKVSSSGSPQNVLNEVKDSMGDATERDIVDQISKPVAACQRAKTLEPQLSLITEQTETCEKWNPDYVLRDQWDPVTLTDLQLTPPEDGVFLKPKATAEKHVTPSVLKKKLTLDTLTPETSKEEDEGKRPGQQMELLDFWTYSAQKGFLKSDSGTTTSYPESLDMWNMTIRDDSLSPLTTPDNLSENAGSFSGLSTVMRKDASLESPLGYSNGGMAMWNTTIQEESSSTTTTPEGPEHEKDLACVGLLVANSSPETEERGHLQSPGDDDWRGVEHNVKIVIETADSGSQGEEMTNNDMQSVQRELLETGIGNLGSAQSDVESSPHISTDLWELPVHGMVTSTSEYDNIGAGGWSHASSLDNSASPVVDLIHLEDQSSPFIAVPRLFQNQRTDPLGETQADLNRDQTENQMFVFDKEFDNLTGSTEGPVESKSKNTDWMEQSSEHSPFVLVDQSTVTHAKTQVQTPQSLSLSQFDGDGHLSKRHDGSDSASSLDLTIKMANNVQEGSPAEKQELDQKENKIAEEISLSCSPMDEREAQSSPSSLHSGHQNNHETSSDGDSFSTLEMEYIVMPGAVKETNRESANEITQEDKQSKVKRSPMETFSMLSYAATALRSHTKSAQDEHLENTQQSSRQQTRGAESKSVSSESTDPYQSSLDYNPDHHILPGKSTNDQSKKISETFHQSNFGQTEESNSENESGLAARSVSPSLRYPSDHFLKTREEVYVHSQISMEDSDEGGHSPPAPPPSTASLADFKLWGGQLVDQDVPPSTSEAQSPALTNSSVSQNSSLVNSPVNELCFSTEKGLDLPFSGDLMEEEHEDDDTESTALPKCSSEEPHERKEREGFEPPDLLSFTEDLIEAPMFKQTNLETIEQKNDGFLLNTEAYYDSQFIRMDEQQIEDHEASGDIDSPVLRRHQDRTCQPSSQPINENAASDLNASLVQNKYGYNYHHIDQRTENQHVHPPCAITKPERPPSTSDVYAEFTTDAQAEYFRAEQIENQTGASAHQSLRFKCHYITDNTYVEEPTSSSELQDPQYEAGGNHSTEDRARYVSQGYVHFHLSRNSHQGEGEAATMMKMDFSEEAAEKLEDREDPSSSADTSAGSNHRRKLSAPPINPSLERSEGSLRSEDALDTDDDALDTGDDLDASIDGIDTPDEADSLKMNVQDPSSSADTSAGSNHRRKLSAPPINPSLERSEGSLRSEDALDTDDDALDTGDDLDASIDGIDTPDEADSLKMNVQGAASGDAAAERRGEEKGDDRLWRSVVIGEQEHRIDMKCIQPYKKVISHGGYYAEKNAIIVFAACFLPDSDCENYNYVMENLFLYVISTLELMVAEDYMIVYLNGATPRRRMPGFTWMKRCYQMIDRRLKKNLKMFIIVHPSWFIRTLLGLTRPFISSKFSSKIKYVHSLQELGEIIPMEYVHIPPSIIKVDKGKSAV
ncbi:uncharacterized protein LOC114154722 isoform X2 [Xiphophorus couchianus]|uniref:uncharacterized protein LOC114154722 isoform X2 n=1 Tax=Xiphophorus couchianus TaxID=32473 RepID=UPI001016483D|nr:uncharacterized protein LOC114154722 isoform X2 [Xiphophorus couchianus]